MKFGLFAPSANPFATPDFLRALGRGCDERSINSLWFPEHVVLFDEYASSYPYSDDGRIPAPPGSGMLDPFNTMAFVAGCTESVRLGSGIALLPQRNPVYTGKEISTLDWLSDGRIDFGIGVGWLEEEFDALGVSWPERGRRADDYLRLLKALWSDEVVTYEGEFHSVKGLRQDPKPVQDPHPPIIVGGESDAAMRRVARLGDGWLGFNHTPETAAEHVERLGGILDAEGRAREEITVKVCSYFQPVDASSMAAYAEAGVDEYIGFFFAGSPEEVPAALDAMMPLVEEAAATE